MLIRRLGVNRRTIGYAALAVAFVFCLYLYYDLHSQLKLNEARNQRLKALQNSLSTQLQVVYEHKSRLERAIQDEKDNHHKTKSAKQDLEMKFNLEKQELVNRIQSVNQKQNILKSQFAELQKELEKSEADFQLLKVDHQKDIDEYKEKILLHSRQWDKDRKYLREEIEALKLSKKEFSDNLAQCQTALKLSEAHANAGPRNGSESRSMEGNVGKPGNEPEHDLRPIVHIEENPLVSPKLTKEKEVAVAPDGLGKKPEDKLQNQIDQRPTVPAFQPVDNLHDLKQLEVDQQVKHENENEQLQAAPPPPMVIRKPEPVVRNVETNLEHRRLGEAHRDPVLGGNEANVAVIESPNEADQKEPLGKNPDADDDREDAALNNDQNEGDQKEEDDYNYDKNVDDEEKVEDKAEEKADDFPDAIGANKILNKIRNPVYPDGVEVVDH